MLPRLTKPQRLHFRSWEIRPDTSLSAIVPPPAQMSRCGIYRLYFDDGETYIGQTVNILTRFATHRRRQQGTINRLDFCPVERASLNRAERDEVALAKSKGWRLRNKDLVDLPISPTALESYVAPAEQEAWLNGDARLVLGRRRIDHEAAARTKPRFCKLQKHPGYARIVQFYADYVEHCIPHPHRTERRFWTMTSYPATNRASNHRRLSALSINNVEVVVFYEDREGGVWRLGAFLNCAVDTRLPLSLWPLASWGHYVHVGDVLRLELTDDDRWWHVLDNSRVRAGARSLSMGLLRKGSGMMARFHDYNLAEAVFKELRARDSANTPHAQV